MTSEHSALPWHQLVNRRLEVSHNHYLLCSPANIHSGNGLWNRTASSDTTLCEPIVFHLLCVVMQDGSFGSGSLQRKIKPPYKDWFKVCSRREGVCHLGDGVCLSEEPFQMVTLRVYLNHCFSLMHRGGRGIWHPQQPCREGLHSKHSSGGGDTPTKLGDDKYLKSTMP